jgi:hypothetical protein
MKAPTRVHGRTLLSHCAVQIHCCRMCCGLEWRAVRSWDSPSCSPVLSGRPGTDVATELGGRTLHSAARATDAMQQLAAHLYVALPCCPYRPLADGPPSPDGSCRHGSRHLVVSGFLFQNLVLLARKLHITV